jgi:hypothetical protein
MAKHSSQTSKKLVPLQAEKYSLSSPTFGRPKMKEYPEFISVLLKAVEHFGIDASEGIYPKKNELVAYFMQLRLSTGSLISLRQAQALATFCRPAGAMKGGNKKVKREG